MSLLQNIETKLAELAPGHVLSDAHKVIIDEVHAMGTELANAIKTLDEAVGTLFHSLNTRVTNMEATLSQDATALKEKIAILFDGPVAEIHAALDAVREATGQTTAPVETIAATSEPSDASVTPPAEAPSEAAAPVAEAPAPEENTAPESVQTVESTETQSSSSIGASATSIASSDLDAPATTETAPEEVAAPVESAPEAVAAPEVAPADAVVDAAPTETAAPAITDVVTALAPADEVSPAGAASLAANQE